MSAKKSSTLGKRATRSSMGSEGSLQALDMDEKSAKAGKKTVVLPVKIATPKVVEAQKSVFNNPVISSVDDIVMGGEVELPSDNVVTDTEMKQTKSELIEEKHFFYEKIFRGKTALWVSYAPH